MKTIKSLHIVNFQSHKDTFLEFCDGVNVITGLSRNGKSAIKRALRWVYRNEPLGCKFMRVGETYCEVTVTLMDGTVVTRKRDENEDINGYILSIPGKEEQPFSKFNKEVPLEVQQALGVYKLWIDKDKSLELNFAHQMDAAFMVCDSPGNRAKIIGRIVNLQAVDAAERAVTNDLKTAKSRKKTLKKDIKDLNEKLTKFDDLPCQENALEEALILMAKAIDLTAKADKLQEIEETIINVQMALRVNQEKLEALGTIEEAKTAYQQLVVSQRRYIELSAVNQSINNAQQGIDTQNRLLSKLVNIGQASAILESLTRENGRLSKLQCIDQQITSTQSSLQARVQTIAKLKQLGETKPLLDAIKEKSSQFINLTEINDRILINTDRLQTVSALLNNTKDIEQCKSIITQLYSLRDRGYQLSELDGRIKSSQNQLRSTKDTIHQLSNIVRAAEVLKQIQEHIARLNNLQTLHCQIQGLTGQYKESKIKIADLEKKCARLLNEYTGLLKTIGRCPTCHTTMTTEVIEQLASSF